MINLQKLPKRFLNSKTAFLTQLNKYYDETHLQKHPVFKKATHFELHDSKAYSKWGFVHFASAADKNEALALATTLLGNSTRPATSIPIGNWCKSHPSYLYFTKLERHGPYDTIEIDGIIDKVEDEKVEDFMKKHFEGVSEVFVFENATFDRNWKPEIGCTGKFARVSFDSLEAAQMAGKMIRKDYFCLTEEVRLTGGYTVNSMDNDKKFIHQLVGVKKFKKKAVDEGNSGNYEKSSGKSDDQHAHVFDL